MTREVWKRTETGDWEIVEMKTVEVGDIISIHDNGKYQGMFRVSGPPYQDKDGYWTVNVSCMGV